MRMLVFNIVPTLIELSLVAVILLFNFGIWYALITVVSVCTYIFFTVRITEWRKPFCAGDESTRFQNQYPCYR